MQGDEMALADVGKSEGLCSLIIRFIERFELKVLTANDDKGCINR
jgi:hypothetical protein